MRRIIIAAAILMLLSPSIIYAAEQDQSGLPMYADRSDSSPGEIGQTEIPLGTIPTQHSTGTYSMEADQLSHEEISTAPQKRGFLDFFSFFRFKSSAEKTETFKKDNVPELSNKPDATSMPIVSGSGDAGGAVMSSEELAHDSLSSNPQASSLLGLIPSDDTAPMMNAVMANKNASPGELHGGIKSNGNVRVDQPSADEISHQELSISLQDKGMFNLYTVSKEMPSENRMATAPDGQTLVAQTDPEELSHQALTAVIQKNETFYMVKTSGVLPIMDQSFRDFIDYGGSISFSAGKQIKEKLSITLNMDIVMMTGDWSIKGDTQSIQVAAEEWYPGYYPGVDVVITPEDLPDENLGTSYHGEAEALVINAESLKTVDIHTDMYLFPLSVNALYRFKTADRISAYATGGLGICAAIRDCNSKAIKGKYFLGPEYKATLNDSQAVTGMLLSLGAGVSIPVYDKLKFVAEASTTLYDLKSFDPILEISFTKPNPDYYPGSDLTKWSYEAPLKIGVFKEVYVTNVAVGFVVPF